MILSLKIFSRMRDFYLFIVCVLKFLWPDLIYYLTSWYACSMQNNCSAGLPKTKDKQKRSSGCCLVVVSAFSPLKHYLNKLKKKKVSERIKDIYVSCVCQGLGIPVGAFSCLQLAVHCTVILQLLPFSDSTPASVLLFIFYLLGDGD